MGFMDIMIVTDLNTYDEAITYLERNISEYSDAINYVMSVTFDSPMGDSLRRDLINYVERSF